VPGLKCQESARLFSWGTQAEGWRAKRAIAVIARDRRKSEKQNLASDEH